jgi:hypothetical protein
MDDARDGFLGVSQSNTQPIKKKPFLLSCCVLSPKKRPFYPGLLQQIIPGSIILNQTQKVAGQEMVPTGHTRTFFSLAQHCKNVRRLCGK